MDKFERMNFRYLKRQYRLSRPRKTRYHFEIFGVQKDHEEDFDANRGIFRSCAMDTEKLIDRRKRRRIKRRNKK